MRKRQIMRKSAAGLAAVAMLASMTACQSTSSNTTTAAQTTAAQATTAASTTAAASTEAQTTAAPESNIEKPKKISVMFNGNVFTTANGQAELKAELEKELGVELEFIQPDHSSYNDNVAMTFAGGDIPDVVLLNSSYYVSYAAAGALWDCTDAWENSELKASGRVVREQPIENLRVNGRIYGFGPMSGNGCMTYIKKSWLDNVGLEAPTTYDEYLEMLKRFTEMDPDGNGVNGDTYGVSAAGIISPEYPWVQYLPEFYQDAYPEFYQKDDGTWADGFAEDAMIAAMTRMKDAYSKGYIDKEIITNKTSDVRNKFWDNKFGVMTYWAGTWAENLRSNLEGKGLDDELVLLPPIEELDGYQERRATNVWCITKDCENPEGVFKYFIEPMLDGGKVQTLWTWGVEGVHYSTKAETVTWGTNSATYQEGQFHTLPNLENPTVLYTRGFIDPMLCIGEFDGGDPGAVTIAEYASRAQKIFNENAVPAAAIPAFSEVYSDNIADINDIRKTIMTSVVTGDMTPEDGIAQYKEQTSDTAAKIIEDLNSYN